MTRPGGHGSGNGRLVSTLKVVALLLLVLVLAGRFVADLPSALDFVHGALTGVLLVVTLVLLSIAGKRRRT